jgi:hypothetical protein
MQGDALAISPAGRGFDAVTIAFGLRNMADRARCLSEIRRVLRPGGRLLRPRILAALALAPAPLRPLPAARRAARGGALTGDRAAYEYLGDSIEGFPGAKRSRASSAGPALPTSLLADDAGRSSPSTRPPRSRPSVERLPAAAGRVGVGILDLEALAVEPVVKVDRGAVEVLEALGIDDDRDALALERGVVRPWVRRTTSRTACRSIRRARQRAEAAAAPSARPRASCAPGSRPVASVGS